MKLYLIIISASALIISAIVTLACDANYLAVLGLTALAIAIVILIDSLVATVARLLPKKCADHTAKIYQVGKGEKKFYEKLKIRKWKDKVPEIGHFTGFRKNKIAEPKSVEYVDRFLLEICYGEIGHFFCLFIGFTLLLLFPISKLWLPISIPVAIINVFLNLPSLFILRYNSYKLRILRKNNVKKQFA
ncbi:MAG: hypothetical protein IJV85_05250 [Clostridia bacterium]|nr:hypothetical protein [Clostridia bacterium]